MMKTTTFKINGMHCTSCALNIDFELEDIEGIIDSETHYAKQVLTVTFDPDKAKIEDMTKAIEALGYDAIVLQND